MCEKKLTGPNEIPNGPTMNLEYITSRIERELLKWTHYTPDHPRMPGLPDVVVSVNGKIDDELAKQTIQQYLDIGWQHVTFERQSMCCTHFCFYKTKPISKEQILLEEEKKLVEEEKNSTIKQRKSLLRLIFGP